jgi:hypothetical protein
MGHLWDALSLAYLVLGFESAGGGDDVFQALVLARIVEPTSKLDSLRVLTEAGIAPVSYRTLKRACPRTPPMRGESGWRRCAPTMSAWDRRPCCSTT